MAALKQNRWQDYSVMGTAMLGITIPTFVTAPLLTLVFGIYGISLFGHDLSLPVGGWNGGAWRNMILPVTVLALPQIAIVARMMRGSMVEVLRAKYSNNAYLIMVQGATPIPYKLVTIASGLAGVSFPLFMLYSAVTRSVRYLVIEAMLVGLVEGEALLEVDAGQRKLSQIIQDRLQRGVDPHEARRVLLVLGQGEALLLELPRRLELPSVLIKGRQTS